MKQLLFVCLAFFFLSLCAGQTDPCLKFSNSCAKCNTAPGLSCRFIWVKPGLYNSAVNGTCVNSTTYETLRYNNQYVRTIWAYSLKEEEINTTRGQYLLSKPISSLNYFAQPVPCYDRHLCYCKPMPPPPPSTLRVTITDCTSRLPLSGVSVSLNANVSRSTGGDGRAIWYPIAVGTYNVLATASGYTSNSTTTPPIGTNQTVDVALCLNPLPCMVNVYTVLDSNSQPLDGVTVSLGSVLLGTKVTAGGLPVSWNISASSASLATGTISGYSDASGGFVCAQGGVANVTLRFKPVLNIIRVFVRDIKDDKPIFTAFVNLSVTAFPVTPVDNTFARVIFSNIGAGTYTAGATAPGYFPNSTVAGPVVRNQTLDIYIYLREIPCTVNVIVLSNNTGLPIPQATIWLSTTPNNSRIADVNGTTTYTFVTGDLTGITTAFATKIGPPITYSPGSNTFTCDRNVTTTVIIRLNEVLVITLAAVDASSSLASKPLLPFATIYYDNVEVTTKSPTNQAYRLKFITSLPTSAVIKGTAGGFNNKTSDTITFTLANRAFNISLAPQEFTLYFVPAEVMADGTLLPVQSDGSIRNNFITFDNEVNLAYTAKSLTAGGAAVRVSDPPTSQSFVANVPIKFTSPDRAPLTEFAATFTDQVPTNQSQFSAFYVGALDLDTLKSNAPDNATQLFVPIEDFSATTERTIVYDLPYKLNAAYFNIRVTPLNPGVFSKRDFGAQDFCFARVTLKKAVRYTNYDQVGGSSRAVFESYIIFGDAVTLIEIGFPVESYNTTLSNWADTETSPFPNLKPYAPGAAPKELGAFNWPPSSLLNPLFTYRPATKQYGRNPSAKLYYLQDYVLIYSPRVKRAGN